MVHLDSDVGAPNRDAARRLVTQFENYAGWLGGAHSARIRTSVRGLVRAVADGDDPGTACRIVQAHLNRLTAGGVTPLLRQTMRNLRTELGVASL
jgi:hypothetical protein